MKIFEDFTATVEQLIRDINSIAFVNPNQTFDFNFHGTTLYIDGIKSMPKEYHDDMVILSSSPNKIMAISAQSLLNELNERKRTAKVLLQGKWMLYDLKKDEGETIFHYCDTGKVSFGWEDCDVRLITAQELINDIKSFSDQNPDRKIAYLNSDNNMQEKLHYISKLSYIEEYGVYVMRECEAVDCATASSLLEALSANPEYAQKGVVVYHNKCCYKTIRFDSKGVFFEGKDRDADIVNFRIERRAVRKDTDYFNKGIELQRWCHCASHYEFVDLGLSVNWASHNIGAATPRDSGFYYAWGEVWPKNYTTSSGNVGSLPFTKNNYKFYHNGHYTKYFPGKYTLDSCDDVAHVRWGDNWRLPTKEEFEELIQKCKWVWISEISNKGYKVTGPNGNSIFLPAAGCYFDEFSDLNDYKGIATLYWSGSSEDELVYILDYKSGVKHLKRNSRYYGIPVRAVCPKISK